MSSIKKIEAKYPLQGLADLLESYGKSNLVHHGTDFHTVLVRTLYFTNINVMVLGYFFIRNVHFLFYNVYNMYFIIYVRCTTPAVEEVHLVLDMV